MFSLKTGEYAEDNYCHGDVGSTEDAEENNLAIKQITEERLNELTEYISVTKITSIYEGEIADVSISFQGMIWDLTFVDGKQQRTFSTDFSKMMDGLYHFEIFPDASSESMPSMYIQYAEKYNDDVLLRIEVDEDKSNPESDYFMYGYLDLLTGDIYINDTSFNVSETYDL